jgi:hypothetical protein
VLNQLATVSTFAIATVMLLVDKIGEVSKVAPVDKKASKEELKERALAKALDYELALWCVGGGEADGPPPAPAPAPLSRLFCPAAFLGPSHL